MDLVRVPSLIVDTQGRKEGSPKKQQRNKEEETSAALYEYKGDTDLRFEDGGVEVQQQEEEVLGDGINRGRRGR